MFYSFEGRKGQGEAFASSHGEMTKIIEKIVCLDTLSAASGLHRFLNYSRLPEAVPANFLRVPS